MLLLGHPRQRRVPPFARERVVALEHLARDDDAAARAGAEDGAEHDRRVLPRAVDRFGQREAVRVVGETHLVSELLFEIVLQAPAIERRVVCVEHAAAFG